jgi:hypothetical protein
MYFAQQTYEIQRINMALLPFRGILQRKDDEESSILSPPIRYIRPFIKGLSMTTEGTSAKIKSYYFIMEN